MESTLKIKWSGYWKSVILMLFILPALIWLRTQGHIVEWMNQTFSGKTFWDWMDILLIPLVLSGGVILWIRSRHQLERQRSELERSIATDNQQESAYQDFVDRITELMLKEKLSRFSPEDVRNIARVRTLAVLRGLDGKRKGLVLLFLKDSCLVDREAVVDLGGADLSGAALAYSRLSRVNLGLANLSKADLQAANLSKSYLGEVNLSGANLRWANLSGADLFGANLSGADMTYANLKGANLMGANLSGCCLNEADLSESDLSGVNLNIGALARANLRKANLGGAELLGADLSEADLTQADLSGTQVTRTNLEKAKSLEGAILPDGTKHT
jgi:uncharacterized protein YjbI with pentapeptide repeats